MDEVSGAALAVLFGASAFAPFTDDDTINGTVTAGILQVDLADVGSTPSEDSITFDTAAACPEMTPEDTCTATIQICNGTSVAGSCTVTGSNLEIIILGTSNVAETGDVGDCFSGAISSPALGLVITDSTIGDDTGTATFLVDEADALDPGVSDSFLLTISLDDENNCQGATATYTVTANAQQSATPHD